MLYIGIGLVIVVVLMVLLGSKSGSSKPVKSKLTKSASKTPKQQSRIPSEEQNRKAVRKGELGEYKIDIQLEQLPTDYRFISDILIRTKKGLTQIDHVIVTPVGIFVIETKNYLGKIYGKQFDKDWTQYNNGQKTYFYNPIKQNYGHVMALMELLKAHSTVGIQSIISFTRRCELRIDLDLRTADSDVTVVYDTDLTNALMKKVRAITQSMKDNLLSTDDIIKIHHTLEDANIKDPEIRKQHISEIKKKHG